MIEKWKDIYGYKGIYQISSLGRVLSLDRYVGHNKGGLRLVKGINLKESYTTSGYPQICLSKKDNKKYFLIHRLVAKAFIKNNKNKKCVNHIDGNKKNNNVSNLEWCTYQENNKHSVKLHNKFGENVHNSKLTDESVAKILAMRFLNNLSYSEIADLFDVDRTLVGMICRGERWNHVKRS